MRWVPFVISLLALLGPLGPGTRVARAQESSPNEPNPIDDRFVMGGAGERIDAWLMDLVPAGLSGSVFVYRDGLVVLHGAYGESDRQQRIATTVQTPFPLGTMENEFLLAAVSCLAMDGKLTIDAPLRQAIDLVRGVPGDAVATRRLTEALEAASGRPIRDLIRERLLEKAAMAHTTFSSDPGFADSPRARAYTAPAGAFRLLETSPWLLPLLRPLLRKAAASLIPVPNDLPQGSGPLGMWSTTGDLFRWRLAMQGGTILDTAATERFRAWVHGAAREEKPADRTDSSLAGHQIAIRSDPGRHIILIVAVNNDLGWAAPALYGIEKRLAGGADSLLTFTILAVCIAALFLVLGVSQRGKRGSFGRRRRPNPFPF